MMLCYRGFKNTDPPVFTEIWRSRAGQLGLAQPVSVDLFEQFVFGKLFFDFPGLIFALDDGRPVGFAHAGFGPDDRRNWISASTGVLTMLLTRPDCPQREVAAGLVRQAEEYLRDRGAEEVFAGGVRPVSPFYMGLYGGSELSGVLDSDAVWREAVLDHGYRPGEGILVCRRELGSFQPPMDRRQLQCRRRLLLQVIVDPPPRSRWEAMTTGEFDLTRFELVPRGGGPALAWVLVREMVLNDGSLPGRTAGVVELEVAPEHRRQGLATHVLGEAFRMLAGQAYSAIEAHAPLGHAAGAGLLQKLGFQETGRGAVYRKDLKAAG
jgi:ribosomal protein S18 acetylase RimI-like enzyme